MEGKKLSLLTLIFGIAGIVLTFTPIGIVGLVLAILGLVFSSISKKKEGPNGMQKAGFILSLIALILCIIVVVIVGMIIGAAGLLLASLA